MPELASHSFPAKTISSEFDSIFRGLGYLCSCILAAVATSTLAFHLLFIELVGTARISPVLCVLIILHAARFPRLKLNREFLLYFTFFCYMLVQLFWTANVSLAVNTLAPAFNFLLVMVLFGALLHYHDKRAVVTGMLLGFLAASAAYTLTSGFPFSIPSDFSYNAVSVVYLFGLFLALLFANYSSARILLTVLAILIWVHIVATTSIKTNLGVLLGGLAGGLVYLRQASKLLWRNTLVLSVLATGLVVAVGSSESLVESVDRGASRVALGVEVLRARQDLPGYSSFASRDAWISAGITGWVENPVFGNGVESFRARHGITSHSTPVDILHNSGIIGILLFYALFASLAWRLFRIDPEVSRSLRLLMFAGMTCFLFISLTGTIHYNVVFAAFVAISSALLRSRKGFVNTDTNREQK